MTTILPKEPVVTDRKNVILSDAERRNLRRKLKGSVEVAQDVLNPRNQLSRFVERQKQIAVRLTGDVDAAARKNAPVIGAIGIGAILFALRRPISKWISGLQKRNHNEPEGQEDRNPT